jgi:hypothetical protein
MEGKGGTLVVSLTPCIARPRLLLCKILEKSSKSIFIIIIIIIIIFIRTPPNRYRTRQTYTRTKYVQQNMYNKIAKHNTRCFNNITHNKSRSNQSNYIYFNLVYQSCPSENPRNCSRLSLEEIFLCLF